MSLFSSLDEKLSYIFKETKIIALVGASEKPDRPSFQVMDFLQHHGYRVIPVNPGLAGKRLLGETVVATLADIQEPVDLVDIFRKSEMVDDIVADTIILKARFIWMQIGVINEAAAAMAEDAGLIVVMNRCPKIDLPRFTAKALT